MRRSCSAKIKASDSSVCSVLGLAVHACDPSVCETAEVESGLGFSAFLWMRRRYKTEEL